MKDKHTTHSSRKINSIFTGIALLILAALLSWLSTRYTFDSDWTRNGRHTLSEASREIVSMLDGPVEITSYAREQESQRDLIKKFVGRYQRIKADIVLRFVNPDAVPDEVRALGISINGEMVMRYQDRTEHVRRGNEKEFTNALQRLLRVSERWLAFVEGHGERNPLGKANHDISEWARQLDNRGFKFQPINLVQTQGIPDNTSVLVVAGPLVGYLPEETEQILNYLARGGNLLWLAEPNNLFGLESLADYLGIRFPAGTIIDIATQVVGIDDPTIALVTEKNYGSHPALDRFSYTTLFPRATAILTDADSDWVYSSLLSTGEQTWLETGELQGDVGFDTGADMRGPLSLAISLERTLDQDASPGQAARQQRIIVSGDGDFLSNTYVANSGNMELGIRLVNWLSEDDDFISIPASTLEDAQLNLSQVASGIIGLGFLVILPLCLLCAGALIWWRRKNL